jgi:hypothetical protein
MLTGVLMLTPARARAVVRKDDSAR